MKTRELRIGNYIQVPFGDEEPWVRSVDTINYDSIMTENGRFCFEDEYDFVPLTEEWLLKFGFDNKYSKGKFTIIPAGKLNYEQGRTYFNSWAILNNQPKYVHQLQNLYFSLTGQELTFK
jgi:hypothetical protein